MSASRMQMVNAFDADQAQDLPEAERRLIERRARLLGPAYRLFYEKPVHVVRAEGVWLYGPDGEAYLDVYNNVACVGHCHPAVVAAVAQQMAVLNTHTRYLTDGVLDYAEALLATLPAEIGHVMFTCTGSEANDLALRVARHHTGGQGLIVTETAYHGVTAVLAEASPSLGPNMPKSPLVRLVPPPAACGGDAATIGAAFAAGVQRAIADFAAHGIRPAALLVDTIFSSDGVRADPPGFLREAVGAIHAAGGVFIADEVQPGFGRTGAGMWGFARHGILPDLVTMGKPMGNGYPVAAMAARPEVLASFGRDLRYFNTFGGNPVAAAAGLAVLGVIREEGLIENAARVGTLLKSGMEDLARRFPVIGAVRGAGLFVGADVLEEGAPSAALAGRIVNGLRTRRVLISASGPQGNVLKIRPPLPFSAENAAFFLEQTEAVLSAL
ncbi:aspartate aminotransferase family protein [Acidisoma sp. 7E03]